ARADKRPYKGWGLGQSPEVLTFKVLRASIRPYRIGGYYNKSSPNKKFGLLLCILITHFSDIVLDMVFFYTGSISP
ncbi:MAG: hypothetical protein RR389_04460, partial [Christensenella sp.]